MKLRMRAFRLSLIASAAAAGMLLCGLAAPSATAQTGGECQANPARQTPILFVHGLLGHGTDWAPFMQQVTREIPDSHAEAFDYTALNTQWVTNPGIGARLANYITCMHDAAGKNVVIVAHSMGGLAVREVLREHPEMAPELGLIVTIATPNTGSDAAGAATQLARSVCAVQGCSPELSAGLQSLSAFGGLASGSAEIRALPGWPSSVPVYAMAGNISPLYYLPFLNSDTLKWELKGYYGPPSNTDTLVTTNSALVSVNKNGLGGTMQFTCSAPAPILPMLTHADCEHGALVQSNDPVRERTVKVIQKYLATTKQEVIKGSQEIDGACPSKANFAEAMLQYPFFNNPELGAVTKIVRFTSDIVCQNGLGAAMILNRQSIGGKSSLTNEGVIVRRRDVRLELTGQPVTEADRRWEVYLSALVVGTYRYAPKYCTPEYLPSKILAWAQDQKVCA